jgi:cell division protein FtsB
VDVVPRLLGGIADAITAVRAAVRRAIRGDQPLVVALLAVLVLAVVIVSGPAQSYLDGRARVEALEIKADALDAEIARLEQRAEDLHDPRKIELAARESQGFLRPGEVPYALVPPEVDRPQITKPRDELTVDDRPWFERAWERIRDVVS